MDRQLHVVRQLRQWFERFCHFYFKSKWSWLCHIEHSFICNTRQFLSGIKFSNSNPTTVQNVNCTSNITLGRSRCYKPGIFEGLYAMDPCPARFWVTGFLKDSGLCFVTVCYELTHLSSYQIFLCCERPQNVLMSTTYFTILWYKTLKVYTIVRLIMQDKRILQLFIKIS